MKKNLSRRMRDRRGLNLIELAIVMAVVGLIVGGIYIAASSVYRNVRESATQDDMLQIVQNMRSTYGVQGVIATLSPTNLINAGIIPADMILGTGATATLSNAFGGTTELDGIAGPPAEFTVQLDGLPVSVCSDIAVKTTASGQAGAANVGLISVGMGINGAPTTSVVQSSFPIGPDVTQADCGTAPTSSMLFTYSLR